MATVQKISINDDGLRTATYDDGHTEQYRFSAWDAIGGLFGAPVRHMPRRAHHEPNYSWRPAKETLKDLTEMFRLCDEYRACNGDMDARAAILKENGYSDLAESALHIIYMWEKSSEEEAINFWRYVKVDELKTQVSSVMAYEDMPKTKDKLIDVMLAVLEEYRFHVSESNACEISDETDADESAIEEETTMTTTKTLAEVKASLENHTVSMLRDIVRKDGTVKGVSRMRKAELIEHAAKVVAELNPEVVAAEVEVEETPAAKEDQIITAVAETEAATTEDALEAVLMKYTKSEILEVLARCTNGTGKVRNGLSKVETACVAARQIETFRERSRFSALTFDEKYDYLMTRTDADEIDKVMPCLADEEFDDVALRLGVDLDSWNVTTQTRRVLQGHAEANHVEELFSEGCFRALEYALMHNVRPSGLRILCAKHGVDVVGDLEDDSQPTREALYQYYLSQWDTPCEDDEILLENAPAKASTIQVGSIFPVYPHYELKDTTVSYATCVVASRTATTARLEVINIDGKLVFTDDWEIKTLDDGSEYIEYITLEEYGAIYWRAEDSLGTAADSHMPDTNTKPIGCVDMESIQALMTAPNRDAGRTEYVAPALVTLWQDELDKAYPELSHSEKERIAVKAAQGNYDYLPADMHPKPRVLSIPQRTEGQIAAKTPEQKAIQQELHELWERRHALRMAQNALTSHPREYSVLGDIWLQLEADARKLLREYRELKTQHHPEYELAANY